MKASAGSPVKFRRAIMSQEDRNAEGSRPKDNASQVQPGGPRERKQGRQAREEQDRSGQRDGSQATSKDGSAQRQNGRQTHGQDQEDEVKIGEAGARTSISGIDGR
jgi:hypothetical protein